MIVKYVCDGDDDENRDGRVARWSRRSGEREGGAREACTVSLLAISVASVRELQPPHSTVIHSLSEAMSAVVAA